ERGLRTNLKTRVDAIAWWIDSGATTHVCKDRCWFKTYEPVEDRSILYMGDDHLAPVHGKGSVCGYKQVYESDKYILSKSGVFVELGYYNNGHVHYKRMLEMSKDDLIHAIDENPEKYDASRFCYVYLLHAKDEALDKFRIYKPEVELQQNDLIKTLRTDKGGEYYDHVFFQYVGIFHETTNPYTPQQNGVAKRKNRALKKMVNSMLSYSGLSEGFWGEAMLTAFYLLNMVPNKRNKTTLYELWYKKRPNLSFFQVWGCRVVVRLPGPKRKTLDEKGIDCIFVGYAEHSKAYRFYVIEPNDFVSINSIIESKDAIFDDNRFSSIPRPKDIIPNFNESQTDDHSNDIPSENPEPRKGKRARKAKSYGSDFHLYLVEGSRDQIGSQ
ncbi:zinc finger, CCHC-type containing protein, partial [Tanacetum coccineum]